VRDDDCARIAALAPALALGALEADELTFARDHLAACDRSHPEVREAMALAAAIGEALADEDLPSPALRQRLLEAARADAGGARPARAPESADRRPIWRTLAAGAGTLAVAASLALAIQIGQNAELRGRVDALDARLAAVGANLEQAEAWIERAVARGADAYFMEGEGMARQASFMLVVEEQATGAVLLMSNLPELTADEVYELWVERDGEVIGVGTFRPGPGGLAAVTIDGSLAGIRQAMITVEPGDGSTAPSADGVIMQGELSL
jgi:hypothetical protein